MLPADLEIPMVAPADLGIHAADLLTAGEPATGLRHMEGPDRYSPADVADAFAQALRHEVRVETVPRGQWVETFRNLGFSPAAAASYAGMTAIGVEGGFAMPDAPDRGATTLESYISRLVAKTATDS